MAVSLIDKAVIERKEICSAVFLLPSHGPDPSKQKTANIQCRVNSCSGVILKWCLFATRSSDCSQNKDGRKQWYVNIKIPPYNIPFTEDARLFSGSA